MQRVFAFRAQGEVLYPGNSTLNMLTREPHTCEPCDGRTTVFVSFAQATVQTGRSKAAVDKYPVQKPMRYISLPCLWMIASCFNVYPILWNGSCANRLISGEFLRGNSSYLHNTPRTSCWETTMGEVQFLGEHAAATNPQALVVGTYLAVGNTHGALLLRMLTSTRKGTDVWQ